MNGIIKMWMWSFALLVVVFTGSLVSYGATPKTMPDSLVYSFYFRQGDDLLMKDYRNNEQELKDLATAFTPQNATRIAKIKIVGSASPEGPTELNRQLALRRAMAIRNYIMWKWSSIDKHTIEINTQANYYSSWQAAVEADSKVPRKDRVLAILNSNASIATKWANIQLLKGNAATYMEQFIFPQLRNSVACVITFKESTNEVAKQEKTEIATSSQAVTTTETKQPSTTDAETTLSKITVAEQEATEKKTEATKIKQEATESTTAETQNLAKKITPKCAENYQFAIKTNLLQGAVAFAPNLGVEYAISKKSSIELTAALNHWGLNGTAASNKKLAHWLIQSEYRYWLKKAFCGHFFGVHAIGGKYNISGHALPNLFVGGDLMESKYRYRGWMLGGGISYGYHLRFARHWGAEFNLGIGVAHFKYDKYDCVRCGKKLNTETRTYFGPTKAAISLLYNF